MEKNKKKIYKKWWFWVLILLLIIIIYPTDNSTIEQQNITNEQNNSSNEERKIYTIKGEEIGNYGKEITLNANTDMPVKKYLYKIPEGSYVVTTTFNKIASFYIVKDEIVTTGTEEYPEELDYVGEGYFLTNGNDDFNGRAKKSIEITLNADESIQTVGTEIFSFEKLQ